MSTKKCLKCEKEFEGELDVCPACETKEDEIKRETDVETVDVDTDAVVKDEKIEEIKEEPVVEIIEQESKTIPEEPKKKGMNKIMVGVIAIVVALALGFGVKMYMDDQAHKAYVKEYNEYLTLVKTVRTDMLDGGVGAETLTNEIRAIWNNAIWKKDDAKTDAFTKVNGAFVGDFNEALKSHNLNPDTIKKEVEIETNQILVKDMMEKLKVVPEGLEDHYTKITDLYDVYLEFTDIAINPTGSLKTYSDKVSTLDSDFMTKYNKIDSLNFNTIE